MVHIHIIEACNIFGFCKHYARRRLNGVVQLDAGIRYFFGTLFKCASSSRKLLVYIFIKIFPGGDGVLPFYLTYNFDFARYEQ